MSPSDRTSLRFREAEEEVIGKTAGGLPVRRGNLRDYLDQSAPGHQYRGHFTDQEVQDADADAQADPRY